MTSPRSSTMRMSRTGGLATIGTMPTMKMPEALAADTRVNHPRHGVGQVIADAGEFVVARFGAAIQQVLRTELTLARSLDQALATGTFDGSAETLMRASAMAIRSV